MALIPISITMCYIAPLINKFGIKKSILYIYITYILLIIIVYVIRPTSVISVFVIIIVMDFLSTISLLIVSIVITSFPVNGVIGMYLTMLACVYNLGKLKTIHTKLLALFGWDNCLVMAIVLQIIIMYKITDVFKWV